jgi:hypothetical protein
METHNAVILASLANISYFAYRNAGLEAWCVLLISGYHGDSLLIIISFLHCYTVWSWTKFPMFQRCMLLPSSASMCVGWWCTFCFENRRGRGDEVGIGALSMPVGTVGRENCAHCISIGRAIQQDCRQLMLSSDHPPKCSPWFMM